MRRGWTFAITAVALFMFALDRLIVTTALPAIRHDLGTGLEGLEWTVNAYTLTSAVLLLSAAAIGDRFGRRRVFVVGLAVFTAGSAAAALAPSVDALVAARALQGRRRGSDSAQPDHLQRGRNCAMRNSDPNRPK